MNFDVFAPLPSTITIFIVVAEVEILIIEKNEDRQMKQETLPEFVLLNLDFGELVQVISRIRFVSRPHSMIIITVLAEIDMRITEKKKQSKIKESCKQTSL